MPTPLTTKDIEHIHRVTSSAERLVRFLQLSAPEDLVQKEINILRRRAAKLPIDISLTFHPNLSIRKIGR